MSDGGELEVLSVEPGAGPRKAPVLFVHGAYAGAWCWAEHFLPFFAAAGHPAHAVSLRGHGASAGREHLDHFGLRHYVEDVERVCATLDAPAILVGHSMGGMVVQKLLERQQAPGGVLMASVPPQGLWGAALQLSLRRPNLLWDINRLMAGAGVSPEVLREAMFAQPVAGDALQRYYHRMQRESHRAIWDMTLFDLPRVRQIVGTPLLVLGAERDNLVPAELVRDTARTFGTEAHVFAGMGHGMMLEAGWRDVARRILDWAATLPH